MEPLNEIVEAVVSQLSSVTTSDVVSGTPIQLDGVTVVPISRITMGIGAGGGNGEPRAKKGKRRGRQSGEGTGGAGKVRPVAVVVLTSDDVQVLPVHDKKGRLDRLLDKVPELIERTRD